MRLLNINSYSLREFVGKPPPYAIASHRWLEDELTFQEASSLNDDSVRKQGRLKIIGFCDAIEELFAGPFGLADRMPEWLWIDTICIDKTNMVELAEALNSMFRWYQQADFCLAWLHDVSPGDLLAKSTPGDLLAKDTPVSFDDSIWFKRGWTLQELLAPPMVIFLTEEWQPCGHKLSARPRFNFDNRLIGNVINAQISEITRIPEVVLSTSGIPGALDRYPTKMKKSWMVGRRTTRPEDRVYCQLGIFGVFMPLIYGEGKDAMIRLEEAIERKARYKAQRGKEREGLVGEEEEEEEEESDEGELQGNGLQRRERYTAGQHNRQDAFQPGTAAQYNRQVTFRPNMAAQHNRQDPFRPGTAAQYNRQVSFRPNMAAQYNRQDPFRPGTAAQRNGTELNLRSTGESLRMEAEARRMGLLHIGREL